MGVEWVWMPFRIWLLFTEVSVYSPISFTVSSLCQLQHDDKWLTTRPWRIAGDGVWGEAGGDLPSTLESRGMLTWTKQTAGNVKSLLKVLLFRADFDDKSPFKINNLLLNQRTATKPPDTKQPELKRTRMNGISSCWLSNPLPLLTYQLTLQLLLVLFSITMTVQWLSQLWHTYTDTSMASTSYS